MGVLIPALSALFAMVVVAGCYDPDLTDCTVSCAAPDECADGQVCGADGFCAQPSVAGTCRPPDGAALTIHIEKKGRVVIDDLAFTCESDRDTMVCTTTVPRTGTIVVRAVKTDGDFDRWTTARCGGQTSTCHLVMGDPTIDVGAKFR